MLPRGDKLQVQPTQATLSIRVMILQDLLQNTNEGGFGMDLQEIPYFCTCRCVCVSVLAWALSIHAHCELMDGSLSVNKIASRKLCLMIRPQFIILAEFTYS